MSKTTFEPKTKTMTIEGSAKEVDVENGVEKAGDPSKSTYVEHGKNGWKALTIDYTSYTDSIASAASALGDEIEAVTANGGTLTAASIETTEASQFGLQIRGIANGAYESHFEEVKLPPAPADFPKGSDLYVVRSNYVDFIQLCEERITSATASLEESHNERVDIWNKDAQNAEIATIKQFIEKLETAKAEAMKYLEPIDAAIAKMETAE